MDINLASAQQISLCHPDAVESRFSTCLKECFTKYHLISDQSRLYLVERSVWSRKNLCSDLAPAFRALLGARTLRSGLLASLLGAKTQCSNETLYLASR